VDRDSSGGRAIRYGLDSPGTESMWWRVFPHLSIPAHTTPSLLYNGYQVFTGGKAAGTWRWPYTPSSAEVKERVELHFYSYSGPSWPVLSWPLPLPLQADMKRHLKLWNYSEVQTVVVSTLERDLSNTWTSEEQTNVSDSDNLRSLWGKKIEWEKN
jgi:hypothetical protein